MDPERNAPFALTVVIPCFNEADNVVQAYREIVTELGRYDGLEVLFVDDGSHDDTLARVRALADHDPTVSYLSFTRNFGLEAAFSAGYRYARHPWVLHLDADLQFPPAEAHHLIDRARQGFDAVFGVRTNRQDRWIRKVASTVHGFIARRLLGIEIPAGGTTFRLVRSDLARRIVDLRLGTPYFLATLPRLTRSWTTVPTAHRPRRRGSAKVTVPGLAKHAIELFISFSPRPISLAGLASLLASGTALAAAAAALLPGGRDAAHVLQSTALAGGLAALALIARYLMHLGRGQPGPPQFLIREANIALRAEDHLPANHGGSRTDPAAVPSARNLGRAA